ncbi:hypothetical protein, partial [Leclercia adecarboxylata]|uniref:hypothetical protein n=1 Tax=Leclercia adecarboxylata TaxID=83655 RepID=UPI001C377531
SYIPPITGVYQCYHSDSVYPAWIGGKYQYFAGCEKRTTMLFITFDLSVMIWMKVTFLSELIHLVPVVKTAKA